MIHEVYKMLCIFFGKPPRRFRWERYITDPKDNDDTKKRGEKKKKKITRQHGAGLLSAKERRARKKAKALEEKRSQKKKTLHRAYKSSLKMTPLAFFNKYITSSYLTKFKCLIHYPGREYNRWYVVRYSSGMVGSPEPKMLNVSIDTLKRVAMKSIDYGYPVYFAGDISKDASIKCGLLDPNAFDVKSFLGFKPYAWKRHADAVRYKDSDPNHAMLFRAYHIPRRHDASVVKSPDNDKHKGGGNQTGNQTGNHDPLPTRWLVENSWGDQCGHDGHFVMSDQWFTQHVYNISAHMSNDDPHIVEAHSYPTTYLEPYDIFGGLYEKA